ncbi:MAG: GFA family protein [Pseudomonadota bacterium]
MSPGPILWAGHCHCESCRRATSSPMTSFFGVPRAGVAWTGLIASYASSPEVARGYCEACGAQMFYQSTRWPDETHLYAASLDDPSAFQPEAHYHFAERVPWLGVGDELPKFEGSAEV